MHTPTELPENSGELTGGVRSREVVQSRVLLLSLTTNGSCALSLSLSSLPFPHRNNINNNNERWSIQRVGRGDLDSSSRAHVVDRWLGAHLYGTRACVGCLWSIGARVLLIEYNGTSH